MDTVRPEPAPAPCTLGEERARRLIKKGAQSVRKFVDAVRAEDHDGIHDMRVATRRLRAVLAEHAPLMDSEAFDAFRDRVRYITRQLGKPRELDVVLANLERRRPSLHGAPRYAIVHVIRRLHKERAALASAVAQTVTVVESLEFDDLLKTALHDLSPSDECYLQHAIARLRKRYRALRRDHRAWQTSLDEAALHRVRVGVKKLRYTCEVYEPLYGPEMKQFLALLKTAQQALGDWNDCRVLRDYVLVSIKEAPPRAAWGLPGLADLISAEAKALATDVAEHVNALFSDTARTRLKTLFAAPIQSCCRQRVGEYPAAKTA